MGGYLRSILYTCIQEVDIITWQPGFNSACTIRNMYIKRSKQAGSNCRWRHIMGRYLGEIPDLKIDLLNTRLFQLKLFNGTRQKPGICATGSQFCDSVN